MSLVGLRFQRFSWNIKHNVTVCLHNSEALASLQTTYELEVLDSNSDR